MPDSLGFFVIVVGLPIIGWIITEVYQRHTKLKEKELEVQKAIGPANAEWVARMERVEDRVRVLERIITDKGHNLAEEIERLRDKPLN